MTPAAGLTFAWNSVPGVNNLGVTVESFSDDALKRQQVAEHIQVKMSYDMKVTGADLGYFFSAVIQPKIRYYTKGETLSLTAWGYNPIYNRT